MSGTERTRYDFDALIRIFRPDEGGRKSAPFNGVRWDFNYAEEALSEGTYMIWPDFIDESGNSLPRDRPLPVDVWLTARMFVVADEMRKEVHRSRVRAGTRFYCCEGKRVAEGYVKSITGLHEPR